LENLINFLETGGPLAGLAAIASILAFLLRRRGKDTKAGKKSGDKSSWKYFRKWGPDVLFLVCLAITLGIILLSYRASKRIVDARSHEFLTISVSGGETYSALNVGGELKVHSNSIPFRIVVGGQFSISQIHKVRRIYDKDIHDINSVVPVYVFVTERSKAGPYNHWWAHKGELDLDSNGKYEVSCYLGWDEEENVAEEGDLFGIRTYIPRNLFEPIKTDGAFYDLPLPDHIFISEELPIKTMRPDDWSPD